VQLTDGSQNIVANYQYDGFGNLTYSSGSQASANPYRCNTKWCHAVSGLCNYGYRWYNPSAGRWINRDPINEYGGTNLYAFVGNNPMNALDARGMCGTVEETLEVLEEVAPIAIEVAVPEVAVPLAAVELADAALVTADVAPAVPAVLARAIPAGLDLITLGAPGAADAFVTDAAALEGLNAQEIAAKLAIKESPTGFQVVQFPTPESGLASPVFRPDPNFVGGGLTAGGAPEFVLPNGPIPTGATITIVQ
jgi:RHS repeat-associated protein